MRAPSEGDVIEIASEGALGHEQQGRRRAVVVSIPAFQETGFAIVCPLTIRRGTSIRPRSELEVAVPAGLEVSGVILAHHVRSIDLATRRAQVVASVPRATLLAVRARLKTFLGI